MDGGEHHPRSTVQKHSRSSEEAGAVDIDVKPNSSESFLFFFVTKKNKQNRTRAKELKKKQQKEKQTKRREREEKKYANERPGGNTEAEGKGFKSVSNYFLFTVDFNVGNSSVDAKFGSFFFVGR